MAFRFKSCLNRTLFLHKKEEKKEKNWAETSQQKVFQLWCQKSSFCPYKKWGEKIASHA